MTTAAGFVFDGGLLLCADSQITYGGVSKTPGSKIAAYSLPHARVHLAFAIAGSIPHAKSGTRQIVNHVADHNARSMREVLDAMQLGHQKAYRNVQGSANYQQDGSPEYILLIGAWVEGEPARLFATHDDLINGVADFDCKGTGEYLFRYLIQAAYRTDLKLEEVVALVAHALEEIKSYDPNVGFNSEFLRVDSLTGDCSAIAGYDIGHVENFGRTLQRSMYDLLFAIADLRNDEETIRRAKQLFEDNLMNLRHRYLEDKNQRIGIQKLIRYLSEPGDKKITLEFKK